MGEIPQDDLTVEALIADMLAKDASRLILRSEFAVVSVNLVGPLGRQRLRVEDLRTKQAIELDAIELESIAWARHNDLAPHLDPSATRWTNHENEGN